VQSLLTAREYEILSMVATGDTSPTIAEKLHVSRTTVDTHVEAARLKLGAATRTQAAAMLGLVAP
jgi:DNA-binding CsgD family transcriptional regulator